MGEPSPTIGSGVAVEGSGRDREPSLAMIILGLAGVNLEGHLAAWPRRCGPGRWKHSAGWVQLDGGGTEKPNEYG
jgi:hypothetical protein